MGHKAISVDIPRQCLVRVLPSVKKQQTFTNSNMHNTWILEQNVTIRHTIRKKLTVDKKT